ncbi:MAG: 23S rRNA (pseudouridine(1915)-N(3))-methyltransferase RlmH [Prevotellaceae bacterium]|jgi:23S rRNA (pseudouridine1915-N3)-methyltransferase|nr:23S rRNA (pseudouridine(1915)-N(3))-methyltransferase RlmH [Prevotellaceae bacterium]
MKIKLLVTGKTADKHLVALIDDYKNRLQHYVSFEIVIIPDVKNAKNLSRDELKEREGDLILKALVPADEVILLDEDGELCKSTEFAEFLQQKTLASVKTLVFVAGGAFGFSQRVYARTKNRLSLSKMTFSHQMIRLIFVEQLYRAFTILKGEKYHHE